MITFLLALTVQKVVSMTKHNYISIGCNCENVVFMTKHNYISIGCNSLKDHRIDVLYNITEGQSILLMR